MSPVPNIDPEHLLAHSVWARRLAAKLVADPNLAKDLYQDAWVITLRRKDPVRDLRRWFVPRRSRRFAAALRDPDLPSPIGPIPLINGGELLPREARPHHAPTPRRVGGAS